jgi:hypothetical protein
MLRLVSLATLVGEDQLLREDAGVTRLEASPLEGLQPGVDEVVALDRSAFKVEDDDRTALAGVRYFAEL